MDQIEIEKAFTELMEKLTAISLITNQVRQMTEYLKIQDFLQEIHNKGYQKGIQEKNLMNAVNFCLTQQKELN